MAWLHRHMGKVNIVIPAVLAAVWLVLVLTITLSGPTPGSVAACILTGILTAAILALWLAVNRYFNSLFIKVEVQGDYLVFHRRRKQILVNRGQCSIIEELPAACVFHLSNGKVLKCPTRYPLTREPILYINVINRVNFPNAKLK